MAPRRDEQNRLRIATQLQDRALGIALVEDLFAFGKAEEQTVEADAVQLARHAVAELVGGGDKAVGERAAFGAGDTQMMLDVSNGLLQIEGLEVVADLDALVEGLKVLELETGA